MARFNLYDDDSSDDLSEHEEEPKELKTNKIYKENIFTIEPEYQPSFKDTNQQAAYYQKNAVDKLEKNYAYNLNNLKKFTTKENLKLYEKKITFMNAKVLENTIKKITKNDNTIKYTKDEYRYKRFIDKIIKLN